MPTHSSRSNHSLVAGWRDSAVAEWLLALLVVVGPLVIAHVATRLLMPGDEWRDARNAIKLLTLVGAYLLHARCVERRVPDELALRPALLELIVGIGLGAALVTIIVVGVWLAGGYAPGAFQGWQAFADLAPKILVGALIEELLFRGLLLRLLVKRLGIAAGLVVSTLLFAAAHAGNPGAGTLALVGVGLEVGLLVSLGYLLTGRVWLGIGMHFAWNFTQGGVFSLPVSGLQGHGLFDGRLAGPDWLTGGPFGIEGSVVAVAVGALGSAWAWRRPMRQGAMLRR